MQKKGWLVWTSVAVGSLFVAGVISWLMINSSLSEQSDSETALANNLPPQIAYRVVASDFKAPTDITSTPIADDSRLFVIEKSGIIKIFDGNDTLETPFLDISDKVKTGDEMGLLGMAFHPKFMENGLFYVNYTAASGEKGQKTIISEFKLSDEDQNKASKSSERIVMQFTQPHDNHNAGDLAFGPDDYLYIPTGDGGSNGDPDNKAQNLDTFLGKVLRIDPVGSPYNIPEDNPFVDRDKSKSEIWSYGWRNPWRISFDRQNGEMFVGDVGQDVYEEINREPFNSPGLNYGWNCLEGDQTFNQDSCMDSEVYTEPYAFYGHESQECSGSVTGGFVYRGNKIKKLNSYYVYADFCTSRLYSVDTTQYSAPFTTDLGGIQISTFGEDSAGELYFADMATGDIYQIIDS